MGINSIMCGPGFRFHPTSVELVMYYLKRKNLGRKIKSDVISELDLYKFSPWELPEKSYLRTGDLKWFFFCPRHRKFGSKLRMTRNTKRGYWKATGRDREVRYEERTVGFIKTLIFHEGCAPKGKRTDWVMHEHRLEDQKLADCGIVQDAFVLCEIFKKSGLGPRNGSQYGAAFDEDTWVDDLDVQCVESAPSAVLEPIMELVSHSIYTSTSESTVVPDPDCGSLCTSSQCVESVPCAVLEPIKEHVSNSICTAALESTVVPDPDSDSLCTPAHCVESALSAVLEPIKEHVSNSISTATLESTVVPDPYCDSLLTHAQEHPSVSIPNNSSWSAEPAPLQNPDFDNLNLSEDDILAMLMDCTEDDAHMQSAENGKNEEYFNADHFFDDLEDLGSL